MMSGALPSEDVRPPSVSPYILKENSLPKGPEKPASSVLWWITGHRKRGKKDRLLSQDDEGKVVSRNGLTNHWVETNNSSPAFIHNSGPVSRYQPQRGLSAQYPAELISIIDELIESYPGRKYGENGLPPNARQQHYPQSTGLYPSHSYDRFDSGAPDIDQGKPLQLLGVPETFATAVDNHRQNLQLDLYEPRSSTAVDPSQRYLDAKEGIHSGSFPSFDADYRLQDTSRYRDPSSFRPNMKMTTVLPQSTREPSSPVLRDPSVINHIAKYTMLDENYPLSGESMRITREDGPATKATSEVVSGQTARMTDSDSESE
jgi:hypothetical protein